MKCLLENNPFLILLGIAILGFTSWGCSTVSPAISPELKDRIPSNAREIIVASSLPADELFEEAKKSIKATSCEIRRVRESSRRILTTECSPGQSLATLRIDLTVKETSDGSWVSAITQSRMGAGDSWLDVQYKRKGREHAFEETVIIMNNLPGEISFESP